MLLGSHLFMVIAVLCAVCSLGLTALGVLAFAAFLTTLGLRPVLRALEAAWNQLRGGSAARQGLALIPAVLVASFAIASGQWPLQIVAVFLLVVGTDRLAHHAHPRPEPSPLADRVELAADPRWRLIWWPLAAAVLGSGVPFGGGLAVFCAVIGCLHAERTLVVAPGGLRVHERVLWWRRERWVAAEDVTLRPERHWWGGRVWVSSNVVVRSGHLPLGWLGPMLDHMQHVATRETHRAPVSDRAIRALWQQSRDRSATRPQ